MARKTTTTTKPKTQSKTAQTAQASGRKPSEQALQVVDVSIGVVPTVAENVRDTAETWRKPETRTQEIETLQKRVKSLRDPKARTTEIDALRQRLGNELE